MDSALTSVTELVDVFFNGRSVSESRGESKNILTFSQLVQRGHGYVQYDGKIYEFTVADVTKKITKKT